MISGTRKIGAASFAAGAALSSVLASLAIRYDILHFRVVVLALSLPVALTLGGFCQTITGVPFLQLASQWDALQGWQRGVLGTVAVFIFAALAFAGIILVGV